MAMKILPDLVSLLVEGPLDRLTADWAALPQVQNGFEELLRHA